jgi:dTDP-4-amino-4,6-dideoxygalactose transaminase
VSTLGDLGCFSFQASKNLNCGEGGALLTNNEALIRSARSFHNNGRGFGDSSFSYIGTGLNLRMTEFQAALLAEQLTRLDEQSRTRESNAKYLSGLLDSIGGVTPAKQYDGCTRNAYHLYMFRYDAAAFDGLPRDKFLKAMKAEGIPCSGGYQPLHREPFLEKTLQSRTWKRVYSGAEVASWRERNACPANDRLCTEAVWLTQTMLLGPREDMDQIAEAVRKVRKNARAVAAA